MQDAYRDCTKEVAAKLTGLVETRRREFAGIPKGNKSIYVRRLRRIAFGVAGAFGALVTIGLLIWNQGYAPFMMLSSWLLGFLAYTVAGVLARRRLAHRLEEYLRLTGDPIGDTQRLQSISAQQVELQMTQSHAAASVAWPLIVVALLGPLTLHLVVYLCLGLEPVVRYGLAPFETWMTMSAALVGASHLVFAHMSWRFPARRRPWRGLGLSVLPIPLCASVALSTDSWIGVSVLGGSIATSLIALITGAVLIWLFYLPMGRRLDQERDTLLAIQNLITPNTATTGQP